jgi:hypothetical protein
MEIYCGFGTLVAAEQHVLALADLSRRTSTDEQREVHSMGSDSAGPRALDGPVIQGVAATHRSKSN